MIEQEKLELDIEARMWLKEVGNVENYFRGNLRERIMIVQPLQKYIFETPRAVEILESLFLLLFLRNFIQYQCGVRWGLYQHHLVLPLTAERPKPRVCHDERYLNLWILDKPFHLDTLKKVPTLVSRNNCMPSVDDKSGYVHLRINEESKYYLGLLGSICNTIPFGFKLSMCIRS